MILKEPLAEEKWRLVLLLLKKVLMPISLQPGVLLTPFPDNVLTIASKLFGFSFDKKTKEVRSDCYCQEMDFECNQTDGQEDAWRH